MSPTTRIVSAPEPRDILWSEFAWWDSSSRNMSKTLSNLAAGFLIFVWIVPISLVVALANLEQIVQIIPFLKPLLDQNTLLRSFLTSVLPSMVATLFNVLFPYLLMALVAMQGIHTKSGVEETLTRSYYAFLFVNQLVFFVIGQTVITTTLNLFFFVPIELPGFDKSGHSDAQSLSNIVMLIARSLPKGAGFFLGYTLFQAVLHAAELLQINWGLFINWYQTARWMAPTPRDLYHARKPWSFSYFYYWPGIVLIMNVAILYSVIHPLILIVSLVYFSFGYIVYKHQLLYCYAPAYETNGRLFHQVVDWTLYGLFLFQVTMIGVLATNQIYLGAGMIVPIVVLTIMFRVHVHHTLVPRCRHVPIEALVQQHHQRRGTLRCNRVRNSTLAHDSQPTTDPDSPVGSGPVGHSASTFTNGSEPLLLGKVVSQPPLVDLHSLHTADTFQDPVAIHNDIPKPAPAMLATQSTTSEDLTPARFLDGEDIPMTVISNSSSPAHTHGRCAQLGDLGSPGRIGDLLSPNQSPVHPRIRQLPQFRSVPTLIDPRVSLASGQLTTGRSHTNRKRSRSRSMSRMSMGDTEGFSVSHDDNEMADPNPQTYDPPCLWAPLPSAMWLPVDPIYSGRYDLNECTHVTDICFPTATEDPNGDRNATSLNETPTCGIPDCIVSMSINEDDHTHTSFNLNDQHELGPLADSELVSRSPSKVSSIDQFGGKSHSIEMEHPTSTLPWSSASPIISEPASIATSSSSMALVPQDD